MSLAATSPHWGAWRLRILGGASQHPNCTLLYSFVVHPGKSQGAILVAPPEAGRGTEAAYGWTAGGEPAQGPVVVQWACSTGPCARRAAPICPVSPPHPGTSPSCNRSPARSRPKTDAPIMADSGLFWSLLVCIQVNRGVGADLATVGVSSCLCASCLDRQRYRRSLAVSLCPASLHVR